MDVNNIMIEKHFSVNTSLQTNMIETNASRSDNSTVTTADVDLEFGPLAESIIYIAYVGAIILSVSGNLISIIVFARGRRCNTDIRGFLINLAVADLMMAIICIPFSFTSALHKVWKFPAAMCPVILFTQVLSVTVSVYTNTAISVDRFLAIRFPFLLLRSASRKHVRWAIAVIWIISIGMCGILLKMGRVVNGVCAEVWPNNDYFRKWYTLILVIITYIIPVGFIMTMYGLVSAQLWYRATPGIGDHIRDARQLKQKRKVVKMLMLMIILFTICWMPLHIFFLIIDFKSVWLQKLTNTQASSIYFFVNWLAMSNSFQNPIIYGFVNDNFRSDLAEILIKCCPPLVTFKSLHKAALANQPLSRLSTKMTIMMDKMDSRSDMFRNGKKMSEALVSNDSFQNTRRAVTIEEEQNQPLMEPTIRNNNSSTEQLQQLQTVYADCSDSISTAMETNSLILSGGDTLPHSCTFNTGSSL